MTDETLSGAWAKLGRAKIHASQLKAEIVRFVDAHPEPRFSFRKELNEETGEGRFVVWRVRELPIQWGLLVGDFLNNARTALDHLAWYLVKTGDDPSPKSPTRIQFPIHATEDGFDSQVAGRLPGVSDLYVRMIRERQPIPSNADFALYEPLDWLAEYVRVDKHHQIHAIQASQAQIIGQVTRAEGITIDRIEPGADVVTLPAVLKVGTELVRFHGTVERPEPHVEVQLQGTYEPSFPDGRPIMPTLGKIRDAVHMVLGVFDSRL